MTVLLTALIIADHMVGNNKYGERQSQHYPPSLSLDPQLLPSVRAGLHLIKSFNLDHLDSAALFFPYNTAFGQRHNLRSSSSSTAEQQFTPPETGREKSGEEKGLLASTVSFSASSNGDGGHILPKVAPCAFDDPLFISWR